MYLETRLLKYISTVIFLYFANTNYLFTQETKDLPISVSKPIYLKTVEGSSKINNDVVKNKEYRLFKNSSVYRVHINYGIIDLGDNKNNTNSIRTNKTVNNRAGKYIFAYSQDEVNTVLESFLSNSSQDLPSDKILEIPQPILISNFRVIKDYENRDYFTDGSLIIKFNTNVNFSEFASFNNLMLKKEYVDLNMGIYIHKDFSTLEKKINSLEEMDSISEVQYNVINPYILPE